MLIRHITKLLYSSVFIIGINSAYAFDLNEAYQKALLYNADYLASVAKRDAGQENVVQGVASLLPQIGANGNLSENYLNSGGAYMYYNQPTLNVQLQQVIYDFSKFSQYTKSRYRTEISDLELIDAKQKLILNVAKAYFDVLYAEDNVNTIQITKDAFQQQYNEAKSAFNAGTVNVTDVNDAKSSLDIAAADIIRAQNELTNKENIFTNLTGLSANLIQPIKKNINLLNPNPNNVENWITSGQNQNINIKIANLQIKMAEMDAKIALGGHLPSVYLSGNYQNVGTTTVNGQNETANQAFMLDSNIPGLFTSSYAVASAGVTLNLPIYSGGMVSSQVRQAKSNLSKVKNQYLGISRNTQTDIKNRFFAVQNGVNIVKARLQALNSAALKLKADKIGYKVGTRNSIELVEARKNYSKAMLNYNESQYQYLLDSLNLAYLAGTINDKYLSEINLSNIDNAERLLSPTAQ